MGWELLSRAWSWVAYISLWPIFKHDKVATQTQMTDEWRLDLDMSTFQDADYTGITENRRIRC